VFGIADRGRLATGLAADVTVFDPATVGCSPLRRVYDLPAGAEVEITAGGAGHFEIRVRAEEFAGKSRVAQQRLVYAAITHLMTGETAPVHAIDKMEILVP